MRARTVADWTVRVWWIDRPMGVYHFTSLSADQMLVWVHQASRTARRMPWGYVGLSVCRSDPA